MNRQKRGFVNSLLSLLNVFSGQANLFGNNLKWFREPAAFKKYSPEAQRIKMAKVSAKREMRRQKSRLT